MAGQEQSEKTRTAERIIPSAAGHSIYDAPGGFSTGRNALALTAVPTLDAAPPTMPTDPSSDDERENPSRSAAAYRDYLAERDEILRHKWSLSEAAGQDVGFETALLDWVHHHRPAWRRSRSRRSQDS